MNQTTQPPTIKQYPRAMRWLHWVRACLIFGLLGTGWYMARLPESAMDAASILYPNHKQFGVLVWLLALVHLVLCWHNKGKLPGTPQALSRWEKLLSHAIHRLIVLLTLLVPLMGYSMSSSFSQSDGVPFFFFGQLPELLPKNDAAFTIFQACHKYSAYVLLGCIVLHVAGTLKHHLQDKGGETDVLPRML